MPGYLISTADLAARLPAPNLVVIDVRHDLAKPDTWGIAQYRAGHIPSAIFAHVDRDLSGTLTGKNGRHPLPTAAAAAATFGGFGIDSDKEVVVYDQGAGVYASRMWWMLRWLGHRAAAVLDGGYAQWVREGRDVTTDVPTPRATTFEPRAIESPVDAATVDAGLDKGSSLLVDARAPERFRGEVEPLDPVAGHIPGAINRPHGLNLDAQGLWKPADELRAEFEALLRDRAAKDVVHYCGSGVSACHNVLAMEVAGMTGARLYPGSWSEWCADPEKPLARG